MACLAILNLRCTGNEATIEREFPLTTENLKQKQIQDRERLITLVRENKFKLELDFILQKS